MKLITSTLVKYAGVITVLTVLLRLFLTIGIEKHSGVILYTTAVLYAVSMFCAGYFFGRKDSSSLPIYDVGFRFHATTYLVFNIISELWFILGFNSSYERIQSVHTMAIIWGVIVLTHFIIYLMTRRRTIDNLSKTDLFE